jgi:hypothetical protein
MSKTGGTTGTNQHGVVGVAKDPASAGGIGRPSRGAVGAPKAIKPMAEGEMAFLNDLEVGSEVQFRYGAVGGYGGLGTVDSIGPKYVTVRGLGWEGGKFDRLTGQRKGLDSDPPVKLAAYPSVASSPVVEVPSDRPVNACQQCGQEVAWSSRPADVNWGAFTHTATNTTSC